VLRSTKASIPRSVLLAATKDKMAAAEEYLMVGLVMYLACCGNIEADGGGMRVRGTMRLE
jgi:hypothetical protein